MAVRDIIQAAGGSAATSSATYVEDVFSTYVYAGTGASQTITNGIDLSTKGGLVWTKLRETDNHRLYDTARGGSSELSTNTTAAQASQPNMIQFGTTGYVDNFAWPSSYRTASWTFRKQAKFFDVVTWSGNGTSGRQIPHDLGCVPGMVIVKCTSHATTWYVYHKSVTNPFLNGLQLQTTGAAGSTVQSPISSSSASRIELNYGEDTNTSGRNYVAYLFADSNSGGFGPAGTDSVVACGSFTAVGGAATVNLGWEPQFLLVKKTSGSENWYVYDNMRGWPVSGNSSVLFPNTSDAETAPSYPICNLRTTGFYYEEASSGNSYIYLAIRRGPMKTPTDATKVFAPVARAGTSSSVNVTTGFVTDAVIAGPRNISNQGINVWDRLRGAGIFLGTAYTSSEQSVSSTLNNYAVMDGYGVGSDALGVINYTNGSWTYINYAFRRAPGFFDVVCYTGTGSATTVAHNLGVAPELIIVKCRTTSGTSWYIYSANLGTNFFLSFDNYGSTSGAGGILWNSTAPTSTNFSLGTLDEVNGSGRTFVAYLFATCPGVSKCGSYTGSGTTKQIDCGFTSGARFVLIKRTDIQTGDQNWYVWDTARGLVSGNDPYLLLNSTAAEVTSTDYIDPYSAGFEISSSAPAAINASGGSFIYLAIA